MKKFYPPPPNSKIMRAQDSEDFSHFYAMSPWTSSMASFV